MCIRDSNYIELKQDGIVIKAKVEFTRDSPAFEQVGNSIQIGGRNFFGLMTNIYPDTGVLVDQKTNKGFHVLGTADNAFKTMRISNVITGNGKWTISFDAWGNNQVNDFSLDFCDGAIITQTITDVRKKYSFTFGVQNWSEGVYNFIDFNVKYLSLIHI